MKSKSVEEFRENYRRNKLPRFYVGEIHGLINFGLLLLAMIFLMLKTPIIKWSTILVFFVGLFVGNIAVYIIHRWFLHSKIPLIWHFTYKVHTLYHHRYYTNVDRSYDDTDDFHMLFFPISVILGFTLFFLPLEYLTLSTFVPKEILYPFLASNCFYFILYEAIHWIGHVKDENFSLRAHFFSYLRRLHLIHHNPKEMGRTNFNIVFPLTDFVMRTLKTTK